MKDALIVTLLSVLPRKRGSRTVGWLARRRASRWMTRAFVRLYGVNLSEAEKAIDAYPTLEALFTRALRPGMRPVDAGPAAIVSPVDGTCAAVGTTSGGSLPIAPRRQLEVAALLGRPLEGEVDVVVLYLSPRDYHRVHVPREGRAESWSYVPGTLWPVFPAAVRRVRGLFSRNERLAVRFETSGGPLEVVLVGAFGVGRITLTLCDRVTNTGVRGGEGQLRPPIQVERGAPLGTFHLGSTVVLVAPSGRWTWTVAPGDTVRVGRSIGRQVARLSSR